VSLLPIRGIYNLVLRQSGIVAKLGVEEQVRFLKGRQFRLGLLDKSLQEGGITHGEKERDGPHRALRL